MKSDKIVFLNVTFSDLARLNKPPEHILELIRRSWGEISRVMQPIIGKDGIEALFYRTLEMSIEAYPWLAAALPRELGKRNLDESLPFLDLLHQVLAKQHASQFAAASDTLLVNFYNLITNLIGLSLTDHLLQPMLDLLLSNAVAKDI